VTIFELAKIATEEWEKVGIGRKTKEEPSEGEVKHFFERFRSFKQKEPEEHSAEGCD